MTLENLECKIKLMPGLLIPYIIGVITDDPQVIDMAYLSYFDGVKNCEGKEGYLVAKQGVYNIDHVSD